MFRLVYNWCGFLLRLQLVRANLKSWELFSFCVCATKWTLLHNVTSGNFVFGVQIWVFLSLCDDGGSTMLISLAYFINCQSLLLWRCRNSRTTRHVVEWKHEMNDTDYLLRFTHFEVSWVALFHSFSLTTKCLAIPGLLLNTISRTVKLFWKCWVNNIATCYPSYHELVTWDASFVYRLTCF